MKSQTSTLKSIQLQFKNALLNNSNSLIESIKSQNQKERVKRLDVYKFAYYARLIDSLSEDYPLTKKLIGNVLFSRICKIYASKYPSKHFNINSYSLKFPEACIKFIPNKKQRYMKEVLDYERSLIECFYAVNLDKKINLNQLSEHDVSKAVLVFNPSVMLRTNQFEVAELRKNLKAKFKVIKINSYMVLYRREWQPCFLKVSKKQYQILKLIKNGKTFSEIANYCTSKDLPEIHEWFANWMSLGFFQSIQIK